MELKFTLGSGEKSYGISREGLFDVTPTIEIWADYIYLDTDERRRFAQNTHEYLIEQVQFNGKEQVNENSIAGMKEKFEEKDKKVLQDGTIASGNTNVITVQQNQPVNNTQNVGSTGMITQGNGANPDKGSVYEKLSDFA